MIEVWAGALAYAATFFVASLIRYRIFRSGVDLGIFTQVIDSAWNGFSSNAEGGVNHLTVHESPVLFLCAPILWLARTPLALVALQALASGLVAPPLYLIARHRVSERAAVAIALTALCYPPLVAFTAGDFNEVAFAAPAIAWLAWALDARRFVIAAVFALLTLSIKEDITLIVAADAFVLAIVAWRRGHETFARFFGAVSMAGIVVSLAYVGVIRHAVGPTIAYMSFHFYDWRGAAHSPLGAAELDSPLRAQYVWGAFSPLLGIAFLSPIVLLALPGFVEVLASHEAIVINLGTHYVATWLPFVLLAFTFACIRLMRRSRALGYIAIVCIAVASIWVDAYASPASWTYYVYRLPNAHDRGLEETLQAIPEDASVGLDLFTFAHAGFHRGSTLVLTTPRYTVVDRRCDSDYCLKRMDPTVDAEVKAGSYRRIRTRDDVDVYESTRFAKRDGAP